MRQQQNQNMQQPYNAAPPPSNSQPSWEDLMKQMAENNMQFQQNISSTIQGLQTQIGQLATTMNELKSHGSDQLPSQPVVNPRNVSALMLRSGKVIDTPELEQKQQTAPEKSVSKKAVMQETAKQHATAKTSNSVSPTQDAEDDEQQSIPLPFPQRVLQNKKKEEIDKDKEILETFRRVEVNIPLLEAIKQIPRYAKFLKELCTHKRRLKGDEKISMGRNVSALIQPMPQKCKDPGTFTIPCTIGHNKFENAMLDLGASINVMPMSVFNSLALGPLQTTGVVIQLANRSNAYPAGLIEDVLVRVNDLIFPTDFYILDMEGQFTSSKPPIILGRPFLKTARTKIDVHAGTLSMEFGDSVVRFNILDAMKHPMEDHSVFHIELLEDLVDDSLSELLDIDFPSLSDFDDTYTCDTCTESEICSVYAEIAACLQGDFYYVGYTGSENFDAVVTSTKLESNGLITEIRHESDFVELQVAEITSTSKTPPSLVQPPTLELKPLPDQLKYAFLEENKKLPVIISTDLEISQEEKLLQVLRKHKKAIGWTLTDIPGISPSMCMHRILLDDEVKPVRQPQRRLNPLILDVVKKEVTKLLQVGIIYPISDSTWVSPVQVVPKKSGLTVVKNEKNELIPTRVQNSWRVCIDYRKLNQATRKDHFPLPFIDQMLERLAGKSHYCFLDGFSGYFQIHIAPEDQEKTTFTCPFGTFAYRRMPFGLCNAPGTFQRCMMSIFSEFLEECMEVFMDDFTVYGSSFDACLDSLDKVLSRCIETNLVLNYEKCHFMVKQGIVLGHVISHKGIEVDPAKTNVITQLPNPTCVREIRSFLGHAGFYRRFIKDFSKIALPLSNLLKKDANFNFDDKCRNAFDHLKRALTTTPVIQPPNWTLPFELMCDASNYALGAVLAQRVGRMPHAIYYASRTLDAAQANYTTTEKELLAIVFALDKFRSYLLGSKVIVFSDHAALKYLLKKAEAKPRLIRWMLLLQEFDLEIKDRSGAENLVADHLSRIEQTADPFPIRDDFPDEQLLQLQTSSTPWFADLVNYLLLKFFLHMHLGHREISLKVMLNIMCGMILTCENFVVTKSLDVVCLIMRLIPFSAFVIHLHVVDILDLNALLEKSLILDYIGQLCFVMLTLIVKIANNAREQEISHDKMRCLNNHYYFVKYLMCGALISWDLFLTLLVSLIFF